MSRHFHLNADEETVWVSEGFPVGAWIVRAWRYRQHPRWWWPWDLNFTQAAHAAVDYFARVTSEEALRFERCKAAQEALLKYEIRGHADV